MILLMGVAGAGKSMQGRILADEHGYAWISTGEILRVLVTGKRRQEMLRGNILDDEETIELLDKVFELIDTKQEFVLDGFPRTVPQAEWLMEQVNKGRFALDFIINLEASEEVVIKRLTSRGRPDDTEATIRRRIDAYRRVTRPILDLFRGRGVPIHDIDADRDVRVVHDEVLGLIDKPEVPMITPELA